MNNCDTPGLMPLEQAVHQLLTNSECLKDKQLVDLMLACNRVLANDIMSPIDVPPADNSAMDGYAVIAADLSENDTLVQAGISMAGSAYGRKLATGQCVRIMTGALIPEGADAVVMQENTEAEGQKVRFLTKPNAGTSIRYAGEDIAKDSLVLSKGTRLNPAHLSLLASIGVSQVELIRKPKVALLATGDELTPPGQPLKEGAIYESNRYALKSMLSTLQCDVIDFGIVKDDIESLTSNMDQAAAKADLIVSSGGVSVGDADYVKDVLARKGQVEFWKVAIKPGKPFAFGHYAGALFCGLPGNPVSSFVTFQQLVKPLLDKLSGRPRIQPTMLTAQTLTDIKKRPGRADFQRGYFYADENGKLVVSANEKQGSGVMSSIAHSNCYIVLGQDQSGLKQGSNVNIQPFDFVGC